MTDIKVPIIKQRLREQEPRYEQLELLNLALTGTKLEDRRKVEEKEKEILAFCKEETEKTLCNQDLQEIGDWLEKIADTCVDREARERVWFKYAQQVYWNLKEFPDNKRKVQVQTNIFKPHNDLLFTTFILLGENQSELSTWPKIWTKLSQTNVKQLSGTLSLVDDSLLTSEQVDLAEKTLMQCSGRFHNEKFHESLYLLCMTKMKAFRFRGWCTKRNEFCQSEELE